MRFSSRLKWIWTVGIVVSTAGCSREQPATTATASGARGTRLAAEATSVPRADEARATASDRPSLAVTDTPDGAMRALLDGWGADNPEALWDALPPGYQQDVNELVHLTAQRLHPEAWRWFLRIMQKGGDLFQKEADALSQASPPENADDGTVPEMRSETDLRSNAQGCALLASLFAAIGKASPDDLEELKTADMGRLIRGKGRSLLGQFRKMVQEPMENEAFAAGFIPAVDPAKIRVVLKQSSGDSATVEFVYGAEEPTEPVADASDANAAVKLLKGLVEEMVSDETRLKVALVRVEGKWIPRWLANRWSLAVSSLKSALLESLPAESPRENFGKSFQILAGIEMQLDLWQAQLADDAADVPPPPGWLFPLPPDMGPAELVNELQAMLVDGFQEPDGDLEFAIPGRRNRGDFSCDFERVTRKTLGAKGKRVAVVCSSSAQARTAYPELETDVVELASELLRLYRIDTSNPNEVAEWVKTSGGVTLETDLKEVAGKFSADYIVLFRFDDFRCGDEGEEKWLRGHAGGILMVVELATADDDPAKTESRAIYTRRFDSRYPAHLPVSADEQPRDDFQRQFLQDLLETLSRLLHNPDGMGVPPSVPRA
jgi:hypothetical protein